MLSVSFIVVTSMYAHTHTYVYLSGGRAPLVQQGGAEAESRYGREPKPEIFLTSWISNGHLIYDPFLVFSLSLSDQRNRTTCAECTDLFSGWLLILLLLFEKHFPY